jgi:GTP-binding protein YchF
MKVGIIGLPQSGKTTLFHALLHGAHEGVVPGVAGAHHGTVTVPDQRFDYLVNLYKPKKATPATVEFIDGAAHISTERHKPTFDTDFFQGIRQVDALLHVIDAFSDTVDPLQAARRVDEELLLADLIMVEGRIERLEKTLRARKDAMPERAEHELLVHVKTLLEGETPLRLAQFTPDQEKILRGFHLMTLKPVVVAANVDEARLPSGEHVSALEAYCREHGERLVRLCAEVEWEITQLSPEEEPEFLRAMGIEEPARLRVVREVYDALGLITFFTFNENEVRAWTLPRGSTALDAAGRIHSDMARGFIRAEVLSWAQMEQHGSWENAKHAGVIRLEHKEYVVQDGDVIFIRFKV